MRPVLTQVEIVTRNVAGVESDSSSGKIARGSVDICMSSHAQLTLLESINVVVTFKSVDETLACDHSNESY